MAKRTDTPMTAAELAQRLGMSADTFYRNRGRLHADDGMPAPLTRHRPWRWHRPSIEAWLTRHHPYAPAPAANDLVSRPAIGEQSSDDAWREELHQAYGRRAPAA